MPRNSTKENDMTHPATLSPVLVTGGCGFVGRHLVARLVRDGRHVWIIDDLSTGKHPDEWAASLGLITTDSGGQRFINDDGTGLTWIEGDMRDVLGAARDG